MVCIYGLAYVLYGWVVCNQPAYWIALYLFGHGRHLKILFPGSFLKMLQPINLKLNRVVGHHLRYVAFEVGAIWKNKMATILKFYFWTLT